MNSECVVVVPIYKSLDVDEIMSIRQAIKMTPDFKKVFVAPQSFICDNTYSGFEAIEIQRFDDSFFTNIQGYNRLMLSPSFYEGFIDYTYILIHQTDAYLFKDELAHWCQQTYDYIGAPWHKPDREDRFEFYKFSFQYLKCFIAREDLIRRRSYNNVGNGGLSLRKVSTFLQVLKKVDSKLLNMYLDGNNVYYNEDLFWSVEAPVILKDYSKPLMKEAMLFSLESYSEKLYTEMNSKLPFGCHAYRMIEAKFWKQHIPYQLEV